MSKTLIKYSYLIENSYNFFKDITELSKAYEYFSMSNSIEKFTIFDSNISFERSHIISLAITNFNLSFYNKEQNAKEKEKINEEGQIIGIANINLDQTPLNNHKKKFERCEFQKPIYYDFIKAKKIKRNQMIKLFNDEFSRNVESVPYLMNRRRCFDFYILMSHMSSNSQINPFLNDRLGLMKTNIFIDKDQNYYNYDKENNYESFINIYL